MSPEIAFAAGFALAGIIAVLIWAAYVLWASG